MFLGHYGLALAAKRAAPQTSLGTMTFAAQWLDELWPVLLLAGLETVRIVPGLMEASPLEFVHYPISHSLAAALLWACLIAAAYYAIRRRTRGALVIGGLVLSHWLLDVPMHRPDLPLWPGSDLRVGFGLWNSIAATIVVELALFTAGLMVYVRATRARDRIGRWGLVAMITMLLIIFVGGAIGAPPADARAVALMTMGVWLFVPWAAWVDAHREAVAG